MATYANSTPAPASRRRPHEAFTPATLSKPTRLRRADAGQPTLPGAVAPIRPTRLQCALAYAASGSMPPLSLLVVDGVVAGFNSLALCIALGVWIGGTL